MSPRRALVFFLLLGTALHAADRVDVVWPTPNPAWADGKPLGDYLQHAGSGDPESGSYGGVRNGGTQFHEGLDIKCLARDRRGEPTDSVFAAMAGVVRHVSAAAGDSSYGRYIVLEHPGETPAVYTLYAHLARIVVHEGANVARGQVIGMMGHSSGGYVIPVERAHVHFEIGVMVTRDFQAWYDRRKFGSHNDHGLWNGMNLMGFDPLDFLNQWRAHRVNTFQDYFTHMETAVRLRLAPQRTPLPLGPVAGWEIKCNWTGIPFAWTPLTAAEVIGLAPDTPLIVEGNSALEHRERSKSVAVARRGGGWSVGKDLETVLQQMFGVR